MIFLSSPEHAPRTEAFPEQDGQYLADSLESIGTKLGFDVLSVFAHEIPDDNPQILLLKRRQETEEMHG